MRLPPKKHSSSRYTVSTPEASAPSTLKALGLPEDSVNGFVQPWDPLVRWYTDHDPCYPLVADGAADGVTLYASGPPRVLRNIARSVLSAAQEWPAVRDVYVSEANQTFGHTGVSHLILPDAPGGAVSSTRVEEVFLSRDARRGGVSSRENAPQATRYLADKVFALVVDVPEPYALVRVPPAALPRALDGAFKLEEFSISLVPAALRSFVHHFHPAYSEPLTALAREAEAEAPFPSRGEAGRYLQSLWSDAR